jgi:hypothetical protein
MRAEKSTAKGIAKLQQKPFLTKRPNLDFQMGTSIITSIKVKVKSLKSGENEFLEALYQTKHDMNSKGFFVSSQRSDCRQIFKI